MIFKAVAALVFLTLAEPSHPQSLAPTPPMGWNSWDSYGLTVNEAQFAANVDVLAAKLRPVGWRYAVIDEGWYLENPQVPGKHPAFKYTYNDQGQYAPAVNRFPSSEQDHGLTQIAASVHAKNLLFGLHIIRGIPRETVAKNTALNDRFHAQDAADQTDTCPWNPDNYGVQNNEAGQVWYDGLIKQYASWGVDYLKVDCIASHPYKAGEIAMIHRAIAKAGRPIVLSLSPGPTAIENAAEVGANAQLWRISDDVWDFWSRPGTEHFPQTVKAQFGVIASWQGHAAPGTWPDADMLPLGELTPVPGYEQPRSSRLTHDEQQTLLTLWCISRSPLFMGGNLTKLDAFTTSLLTNPEVLAVDQQGHDQKLASHEGDVIAWTSQGATGQTYLALFNVGDTPQSITAPFSRYGLTGKSFTLRNLWEKKDIGKASQVVQVLPPHGALLLQLRP